MKSGYKDMSKFTLLLLHKDMVKKETGVCAYLYLYIYIYVYLHVFFSANQVLSILIRGKKNCLENHHLKGFRSACPRCPHISSSNIRDVTTEQACFYSRCSLCDRTAGWWLSRNHSARKGP